MTTSEEADDPFEALAGEIVAQELGGTESLHDDGSRQRMYDRDIHVGSDTVALEVTTATDEDLLRYQDAVDKHDAAHWTVDDGALRNSWSLSCGTATIANVRAKAMKKRVMPLLRQLELMGLNRFGDRTDPHRGLSSTAAKIVDAFEDLGISDGTSYVGKKRMVSVSLWGGGEVGPSSVLECVKLHANKCDNVKKLELAADVAGRQLFVWTEDGDFSVNDALGDDFHLPADPPDVPDIVDVVWLGRKSSWLPAGYDRLWSWDRDRGWRILVGNPASGT